MLYLINVSFCLQRSDFGNSLMWIMAQTNIYIGDPLREIDTVRYGVIILSARRADGSRTDLCTQRQIKKKA